MRTNIVLNDELLAEAGRYSREDTKRGIVEEALRTFVEVKAREQRGASYREKARDLDRKLAGLKLRERPSRVLKNDRNRV